MSCGLAVALCSNFAFAEDCENLDSNRKWLDGMSQIQQAYKAGNYDKVQETAKPMFQICSISPSLMYYTGASFENQGDAERALIYYQKASEYLTNMPADASISRQIWYKRYELEHPDRTEEAVTSMKTQCKQRTSELEQNMANLETQKADMEEQHRISSANMSLEQNKKHEIVLWTGVGMGIAGLALLGTGAGIAASIDNKDLLGVKGAQLNINKRFISGWALIGVGIGMTVTGAMMAGIGGYHYSKVKDDAVLSFGISPVETSIAMTF